MNIVQSKEKPAVLIIYFRNYSCIALIITRKIQISPDLLDLAVTVSDKRSLATHNIFPAGHLQAHYLLSLGFGIYPKSHSHAILAWFFSSFLDSIKPPIKYALEAPIPIQDTFEMVQTYGVANDTMGEPISHIPGDAEDSALLGGDSAVKRIGRADGHASIISCVSNLSNTIIGSGMYRQLKIANTNTDELDRQGMLTFPLVCSHCQSCIRRNTYNK
jgi:hypothetical protein